MAPNPKAGDVYTYTGDTPIGTDPGSIPPGHKFTVREVVDADTTGAGDDKHDVVVLEFDDPNPSLGFTDDGEPSVTHARRAFSVTLDQFRSDFAKGK